MRPIKFRYVFKKDYSILTIIEDIEEIELESHWSSDPDMKDYKLVDRLQFTGLHDDKNGKEIYEGDICKAIEQRPNSKNKWCVGLVKYTPAIFTLEVTYKDGRGGTYLCEETIKEEKIEVIGNIYENPELLEVAKC